MNIKQLMKQAQQMQDQMQRQMASVRVEGSAGGGMVKAEMSGNKELLSITIEKEAVDPNDVEMLQDLVKAAVNEASRLVDEQLQSSLKDLDYSTHGGAPLLGVRGVSIICHGKSSPRAIKNALKAAVQAVESRMNEHIGRRLAGSPEGVA